MKENLLILYLKTTQPKTSRKKTYLDKNIGFIAIISCLLLVTKISVEALVEHLASK